MAWREYMQDKGTDKLSASRLLILFWGVGVFLVWAATCIVERSLQSIPESVVTVFGIAVGGKSVQRFGEKP